MTTHLTPNQLRAERDARTVARGQKAPRQGMSERAKFEWAAAFLFTLLTVGLIVVAAEVTQESINLLIAPQLGPITWVPRVVAVELILTGAFVLVLFRYAIRVVVDEIIRCLTTHDVAAIVARMDETRTRQFMARLVEIREPR